MDILFRKMMNFLTNFIPEEIDRLKFISNFSGSYGFALILKNKNFYLLTEDIHFKLKFKVVNFLR